MAIAFYNEKVAEQTEVSVTTGSMYRFLQMHKLILKKDLSQQKCSRILSISARSCYNFKNWFTKCCYCDA